MTRAQRRQDDAAGGREARRIRLPSDASVLASVHFRRTKRDSGLYAYLRAAVPGIRKTEEVYIGRALDDQDEDRSLRAAWRDVEGRSKLNELAEKLNKHLKPTE